MQYGLSSWGAGRMGGGTTCSKPGLGGSRTSPLKAPVPCLSLNLSRPLRAVAELHRPCPFWKPGGGGGDDLGRGKRGEDRRAERDTR